jgi:hypothetical protein
VLAKVFEAAGLTTVAMALVREHAERTRPPRALWVPFYFGFTMGRPDDPAFQHQVLAAALDTLNANAGPVLVDYPDDAGPIGLPQASEVTANGNGNGSGERPTLSAADEITALRSYYERWIEQRGRTAVGLTGVPQRQFRGIIRFLEDYAKSDDADFDERPADVTILQFVRYCADDLKAFCYEARMAQRPNDAEPDIHRWFWGETAVGMLIDRITQRLNATGDARLAATAYGLSR